MGVEFSGNALWHLVTQSDFVSKTVLLILFCMSVLCWAVFLYKIIIFNIKRRQMRSFLQQLNEIQNFDELRAMATAHGNTVPGFFVKKILRSLKALLSYKGEAKLSEHTVVRLETSIDQTIDEFIHHEESYIPILFTCASAAPLLGLFGTVWGLVHSFIRIAQKQSADIATVAPGIAEALITTLAGLVVAIPALIMYHICMASVKKLEYNLYQVADYSIDIIQRVFC